MQNLKNRFENPNGETYGSLQTCIRTNDLELVGDGTHLTSFQMLGNFSFGGPSYEVSIELWHCILKDLKIPVDCVHVHPHGNHHSLWKSKGYSIFENEECVWSDGNIGGYCCEIYSREIEIGNLVNTLQVSTDVGFGWERLLMILENVSRVDETSLFDQTLPPLMRDHVRTLNILWKNNIIPGNKGRNYICRRLLRRILKEHTDQKFIFNDWLISEKQLREKSIQTGKRMWKKHKDKPLDWWWTTFGLTPEDIFHIKG